MSRRRLASQDGWVLVTATSFLAIMLMVGLAVVALGDTQMKRSGEQRIRESSLNLAEGVLYGQGFVLARNWPANSALRYPPACTEQAPAGTQCPNRNTLAAANSQTKAAAVFDTVDFAAGVKWVAKVRDDYGGLERDYDQQVAERPLTGAMGTCGTAATAATSTQPAWAAQPCSWDFNGNKKLWVQARVEVRGQPRNVVAKLQLEKLAEALPQTALTAGALMITNTGNNRMVDVTGSEVVVRCTPVNGTNHRGDNCTMYDRGQIVPTEPTHRPVGSYLTLDQIERFKERAKADGRYLGCPGADADLRGAVVFVEGCTTEPTFANNVVTDPCSPPAPAGMSQRCINQITQPGILLWHCGRSDWQGGFTYVGVIYMINDTDGKCGSLGLPTKLGQPTQGAPDAGRCSGRQEKEGQDVLFASGGFWVWGAMAADGPGCVKLGSNGLQLSYDSGVFSSISSYGTVGLIQNTWRELPAAAPR